MLQETLTSGRKACGYIVSSFDSHPWNRIIRKHMCASYSCSKKKVTMTEKEFIPLKI